MICVSVQTLSELNAQPPVCKPSASTSVMQTIPGQPGVIELTLKGVVFSFLMQTIMESA